MKKRIVKRFRILLALSLITSLIFVSGASFATANNGIVGKYGEKVYNEVLENGDSVTIHEPPQGWNPQTAINEELSYFGYPPRPTDVKEMSSWTKMVSAKWVKPTFGKPIMRGNAQKENVPLTTASSYTSAINWGGVTLKQTTNTVNGTWYVPRISADYNHYHTNSSQAINWVGIGGTNFVHSSSTLVQAGTWQRILCSGEIDYLPFFEKVYPGIAGLGAIPVYSLTISPNDEVYIRVSYASNWNNTGVASFYMLNMTTLTVTSFNSNVDHENNCTDTAEWIMERPGNALYPSSLPTLAHFGISTFQWCRYGTNNNYVTDSNNTVYFNIKSTDGLRTLETTSNLRAEGTFTTTWNGYQ